NWRLPGVGRARYRPKGVTRYSSTSRTMPLGSVLVPAATSKVSHFGGCMAIILLGARPVVERSTGGSGREPRADIVGGAAYPGGRGIRDRTPRAGALRVPARLRRP